MQISLNKLERTYTLVLWIMIECQVFVFQNKCPLPIKEEIASKLGVPVPCQRFWLWAKHQNHTYQPNRPLTPREETQSVGHIAMVSDSSNIYMLKLFLEVEIGKDEPIPPPEKSEEDLLLFFKLYDPIHEELRYVGRLYVTASGKPMDILTRLNEMAGFANNEEIELFKEIKFEPPVMCELVDKKSTFRANQVVRFLSLEKPKEDDFSLELSKLHSYDDVVTCVAQHLGSEDPSKIRLTSHDGLSKQPNSQPIKYRGVEHLSDMLISDILYYEVLDIPLPELQCLKTLEVAFHHATKEEVVLHTLRLPKQSAVQDVINDLKSKVDLSHPDAELRLLEVFYHKIYKIFLRSEKIENFNDQYWTYRAEEIPEEEKNLGPHECLIPVCHFMKETAQNQVQIQNFGDPFLLVIRECETLADIKLRIQKKLQVPDEEFSKWKFAFISVDRPEYLNDFDIVYTKFQRRGIDGAGELYLGLEHTDSAPKRSYVVKQVVNKNIESLPPRHYFMKPVKFYN